jgi:hypothetical protein
MEKNDSTAEKQVNINQHSTFENFVSEGLRIGSHIVASKSHGKTRLMFSIAEQLQNQENVRVIAFDGSETWLYAFSKIAVFGISEKDIIANNRRKADTIEKYTLQNWNLVKLALETHKDILFRLKTRKPSKRGFFIRTVINYLDALQREEKSRTPNHENVKAISFFIEEAANAFSSHGSGTSSAECEEFLTVFNEGRNNQEGFFTASQRLTDFSKTIRSKQIQCISKLSSEDITPILRRLEKAHGLDFANMPSRKWFYEGSTFESPEFKQSGKPYIINAEIKKKWLESLPVKESLSEKIARWFKPKQKQEQPNQQTQTSDKDETEQNINEDEKGDFLMLEDDDLMFSET